MITQEMLQNTAMAMNKIFFATYYCDLTDRTFVTMECTEHAKKMLEGIRSLPEAFERFIQVLVKPEEAALIREFCNIETLPERLEKAPYISCDYDSSLGDGWRQVGFLPAKYDENHNVIHVLFVIRNIDEDRSRKIEQEREVHQLIELQRRAAELVSASEIVALALIDKETGLMRINARRIDIPGDREFGFEEWLQLEESFVTPSDRRLFRKEASLENIKRKLRSDNHYTFEVSMIANNEAYYYIVHHFTEMDDGKTILAVAEDATKWTSVDTVTDCVNRSGFIKRLQIYIESAKNQVYSVLCFDIQNFKAINNWYGFDIGDEVLKEVAESLQSSCMEPLLTCRESADTFFCLVDRKKLNLNEIERLCRTRYCFDRLRIPVSLRCGIYNVESNKETIHEICDNARLACIDNGNLNGRGFCFFAKEMKENYLDQAYILQNYNEAISNGQIEVYYQPVYDAKSRDIVSAEALVRWRHKEQGLLHPGVFIPTLEKSGHIIELDSFVAKQIWNMLERRIRENQKVVPIASNMSRNDLRKNKSTRELVQVFRTVPKMKELLRFEITESSFDDISDEGKELLECLHEMGVTILVDDFGSGYSSLGMLSEFDCEIIKLDISFARSIGNNVKAEILISSMIDIIHKMGMQVIAEGVETKEQYEFFLESDCDYIQGYYFSRPVPQDVFESLLDAAL